MSMTLLAQRRPLGNRMLQYPSNPSPARQSRVVSGAKRARSPDHAELQTHPTVKRVRTTPDAPITPTKGRERERMAEKVRRVAEREQKEAEFKRKYTNAFPSWTFYIDSETIDHKTKQSFKARILLLGGHVDDFFSSSATHFITDRAVPKKKTEDKENKGGLMSPIKLRGAEDPSRSLVTKALEYDMRVWTSTKLNSVLDRCLTDTTVRTPPAPRHTGPSAGPQRSLSRLLQTEKIHGTTERDPTQRRHDYHYFSRGSVFVLVEDINKELATIAAHEYPIVKDKNGRKPWPVLYCHPLARNPFGPFDDKEKKRYEKQQEKEQNDEMKRAQLKKEKVLLQAIKRKREATQTLKEAEKSNAGGSNLRKSLSMKNLTRRFSHPVAGIHGGLDIDLDADDDDMESANASGYNRSGAGMNYIAASGNSVGITSNTGTTSTSGRFQRNHGGVSAFPDKFGRHVVTSLRVSAKEKVGAGPTNSQMAPPTKVPLLRKSKSTNTIKLSKREEGAKPGYCESCRVKFEDFTAHTDSNKHRKFATNPANFVALDMVLKRLQRRTHLNTEEFEAQRAVRVRSLCLRNRIVGSPVFQSQELRPSSP